MQPSINPKLVQTLAWDDNDIHTLGLLSKFGVELKALSEVEVNRRTVNAWMAKWEPELVKTADPTAEARLMDKYRGLRIWDPDPDKLKFYTVDYERLHWSQERRKGRWMLVLRSDDYDPQNPDDDEVEHWDITHDSDFYGQVWLYYKMNPSPEVQIIAPTKHKWKGPTPFKGLDENNNEVAPEEFSDYESDTPKPAEEEEEEEEVGDDGDDNVGESPAAAAKKRHRPTIDSDDDDDDDDDDVTDTPPRKKKVTRLVGTVDMSNDKSSSDSSSESGNNN